MPIPPTSPSALTMGDAVASTQSNTAGAAIHRVGSASSTSQSGPSNGSGASNSSNTTPSIDSGLEKKFHSLGLNDNNNRQQQSSISPNPNNQYYQTQHHHQQPAPGLLSGQPNHSPASVASNESNNSSSPFQYDNSPNSILLVSILNQLLPVSIDNLHTIFSVYGEVLRIVTFRKTTLQALVEFGTLQNAINARQALEAKDMFANCNTLRLSYSQLKPPLRIRQNDEKSRDFTVAGSHAGGAAMQQASHNGILNAGNARFGQPGQPTGYSHTAAYHPQFAAQSNGPQPHASIVAATPHASSAGTGFISAGAAQYVYNGTSAPGSVLLVNNLVPDVVNADTLFTLFGVYGDVLRVKIMYNNQTTGLVQFVTPQQAGIAQQNLDRLELYGQVLSVALSKHNEVKLPPAQSQPIMRQAPDGQMQTVLLTKDYTNSPAHRFRWTNSKNARHVCPPAASLHVSNLAVDVQENDLYNYFSTQSAQPLSVSLFTSNGKTMAFLKYSGVGAATEVLIARHNTKLLGRYVKLTYSHRVDDDQSQQQTNGQHQQSNTQHQNHIAAPMQHQQHLSHPQYHQQMQQPQQQQQQQHQSGSQQHSGDYRQNSGFQQPQSSQSQYSQQQAQYVN